MELKTVWISICTKNMIPVLKIKAKVQEPIIMNYIDGSVIDFIADLDKSIFDTLHDAGYTYCKFTVNGLHYSGFLYGTYGTIRHRLVVRLTQARKE